MGFFFRLEKFVRTTRELEKKIQEFNIRLYDKNSESDYYLFSSTKIRIFISATLGIRIFFLEKKHNPPPPPLPPLEVKWSVPKWNENKVYRPTRQNRFGTTVGSINYWKYCSVTEPPPPPPRVNRVSGSAPNNSLIEFENTWHHKLLGINISTVKPVYKGYW